MIMIFTYGLKTTQDQLTAGTDVNTPDNINPLLVNVSSLCVSLQYIQWSTKPGQTRQAAQQLRYDYIYDCHLRMVGIHAAAGLHECQAVAAGQQKNL